MTHYQERRLGEVTVEGDYATITFERHLPHPPEKVWEALTEAGQLAGWYLTDARIDGRVGGTIDFRSGPAQLHVTGNILAWEPLRVFEHEWNVEPRPELPRGERGVIRWELVREEDGTLLRLTHSHLTRQTANGFVSGTHAFLDRLEAQLDGSALPDWMGRIEAVRADYPGWGS